MSGTYVVGFDGSDSAKRAVDYAAALAKTSGAKLHLVQVLEWSPYSFHTPEELAERHMRREGELDRANATVKPALDSLKAAGFEATGEVRHGHGAEVLCKIAEDSGASQIIIGRTGDSSITARLMGSLAFTLAQAAPVPVTIVP